MYYSVAAATAGVSLSRKNKLESPRIKYGHDIFNHRFIGSHLQLLLLLLIE